MGSGARRSAAAQASRREFMDVSKGGGTPFAVYYDGIPSTGKPVFSRGRGPAPRLAGTMRGAVPGRCAIPQMPDAALAELLDHRRQPRRGILPIRLDGVLRGARIALPDRGRDRVVLFHR